MGQNFQTACRMTAETSQLETGLVGWLRRSLRLQTSASLAYICEAPMGLYSRSTTCRCLHVLDCLMFPVQRLAILHTKVN